MIGRVPRRLDCVRERVHGWPAESTQHCYGFTRRRRPKIDNQAAAAGRDDAVLLREELAAGAKEPHTCDPAQEHAARARRSHSLFAGAVEPRLRGGASDGAGLTSAGVRARPPDVNVNTSVAAAPRRPDGVVALKSEMAVNHR